MNQEDFNLNSQEYYTEIIIFGVVASCAILFKIFACCHSLGLSEKHKELSERADPISRAEYYNLQTLSLRNQEPRKEDIPLESLESVQRQHFRNSSTQTEIKREQPAAKHISAPFSSQSDLCALTPHSPGAAELIGLQKAPSKHIVEEHLKSAS